jgi:hypothetical protein
LVMVSFLLTYEKLSRRPSIFRSFTGLEVSEFDSIYEEVESKHDDYERKRLYKEDRKRKVGAGRPFKLDLQARFLMLLVYYRLYITSTLAGFLFDLDQSNVLKDIRKLEPLVKECIPIPKKLYDRAKRARTLEEVEDYFPCFKAFLDVTEQEIPRPKNKKKRRTHYSGKKKRHTVKVQLTVNNKGIILHKPPHARGRRHDYSIFKTNHPRVPPEVNISLDRGYEGVQKDYPELNTTTPYKKRRGQGLTPEQKSFNRKLASERVVVEHSISRLKKFRIVGEKFRNRLRWHDTTTDIVAGLVNYRIIGTTL